MIENLMIDLEPYMRVVVITLLHSVWQGFFLGLLAAITLVLLRNRNARIRYAVSCGAMLAFVIAVTVTAVTSWPNQNNPAGHVSQTTVESDSVNRGSDVDATSNVPVLAADIPVPSRWWQQPSVSRYIFMVWIAGVLLLSAYHLLGWSRARRLVKIGTSPAAPEWQARLETLRDRLKIKRLVTLLESSVVKVPCVVSWIKPVVLMPLGMFTSLNPDEVEMILAHELAHVRRYDVLINIVQSAVETLFFFNPAIWWISRQIRIAREDCCDDIAIQRAGDRLKYARALTNLEELRMLKTSFGSAISGAPLKHRIWRIVGMPRTPFYSSVLSISGILLITSLIAVALGPFTNSNDLALQASENTEATQTFKPEPGDLQGEWETEMDGEQVRILVYGRKSSGMSYVLNPDELINLVDRGQEPFRIARDAGTLFLLGRLKEHNGNVDGSGSWYFRPDTAYMRFMRPYGLPENDCQKTFSLAIRDISRKYLTEMEDRGYHDLDVDQLISAGVFGISPELVDQYRKLGYPDLTYQQLLSMQVQGVNPDDAREFERSGIGRLTADQLISAKISGITPRYVAEFREAGFQDLSFSNLGTLHAFGIDADDFKDCYRNRFMDLSEENMVWVCGFGMTRDDIERMKDRGYTDIDSIIKALAEEYGR